MSSFFLTPGSHVLRGSPTSTLTFTYDATGRMLTATNPESQLSWTYDKAGRILQETADGRTIAIQ
ncbi:hypothetical protein, partial [Endozoicomonas sp. ALB115]|uniref:hypothetical protein n=1 Tax=Endozoicomonas sp. ALB115 TaxID=3403074 RepID=UPI003BB647A4